MNVNLNIGGLLGALIGSGAAFAYLYDRANGDPAIIGSHARWLIASLIVGAIAGNLLWSKLRGKRPSEDVSNDKNRS